MKILTILFYLILVTWYIANTFFRIPYFNWYDIAVGTLWVLNIFFIVFWNRKLWKATPIKFGEKIGYALGSIIVPYIVIPMIIFRINRVHKKI